MKNNHWESKSENRNTDSHFFQNDHSAALLAEQIKLLYQQAPKALAVTLVIAAALAFIFWNHVAKEWIIGWLAAIYLLSLIRFLLIRSYFRTNPAASESAAWGHRFFAGVLFSGVGWGVAGSIFFIDGSATHQLFLAYLLAGMIVPALWPLYRLIAGLFWPSRYRL